MTSYSPKKDFKQQILRSPIRNYILILKAQHYQYNIKIKSINIISKPLIQNTEKTKQQHLSLHV